MKTKVKLKRFSRKEMRDCETRLDLTEAVERILNQDLSAQEKLLLVVIAAEITDPPLTQSMIAKCLNLSVRRVKQLISNLKTKGILRTFGSWDDADARQRNFQIILKK